MYILNITLITAQKWIGRQQIAEEITQNGAERDTGLKNIKEKLGEKNRMRENSMHLKKSFRKREEKNKKEGTFTKKMANNFFN